MFAAASLTEAFREVGAAFTATNPGVEVTFAFDASSALAAQVVQGAPADLFASADAVNMDRLTAAGLAADAPVVFASNVLQIVTGAGNPEGIDGLADLARPGLKVVLCDVAVPCGRYAAQSLERAAVALTPVSLEQNVKGVVTKVAAGEADAGIVYATDVQAAGTRAVGVDIPPEHNVVAAYPIAVTTTSKFPDASRAFVAFLVGAEGRAILARYGFGRP